MKTDQFDKEQKLVSTTDAGKKPKKRIANAQAAFSIYEKLEEDNAQLAITRAKIQGQVDGNAPFSESQMKRMGMSWVSNVNFRETMATINLQVSAVWDMLVGTKYLIEAICDEDNPQEPAIDFGRIVAEEFTRTVRDNWGGFHYNVMLRLNEMFKMGVGPCLWNDEFDWHSEAVQIGNFKFPLQSRSSLEELPLFTINKDMDPIELLDNIEDEKAATAAGWKVAECRKFLVRKYTKGQQSAGDYDLDDWAKTQKRIRNNDWSDRQEFTGLRVVYVLVKEASGRITQMIIPEDMQDKEGFLFEMDERFEDMKHCLHMMLFNIGDGYISGIKGLGHELYATNDISNRLINSTLTGAIISSGLIVQPRSGFSSDELAVTKIGPVTFLHEGVEAVQSSFAPPINNLIAARSMVQMVQNNNVGIYKNGKEDPNRPERTAAEARIQAGNEARFETNQSSWYYVQWEEWLRETFRRMVSKDYPEGSPGYDERKEFLKRCDDRGVPKALVQDIDKWEIFASRAIGMGSTFLKNDLTQQMMGTISLLDEVGRTNVLEDWYGARMSWKLVDRYVNTVNRNEIITHQTHIAEFENHDHSNGQPCAVASDDPHVIHLNSHLKDAAQSMKKMQEAQEPQVILAGVQIMPLKLQHIGQHIEFMAKDKTRAADTKKYLELFKVLAKNFQQFQKMAQQIMKQQEEKAKAQQEEQQQALDDADQQKFQLELEKIKSNERVEMAKAESMDRVRMMKAETSIKAQIMKTMADLGIQQAEQMTAAPTE